MESKSLEIELKAEGTGAFSARFATFDVIDAHDDVTRPGAFKSGTEVLIGGYNHETGVLPVGKGTIRSDSRSAWVEGRFNLNTTGGRDTYEAVKDAGALMEWSYLLRPTRFEYGEHLGKRVRFLNEIEVFSVDPVLKGAGIDTRTLSLKSALPYADHADDLIAALADFARRTDGRLEMRAAEGRTLGADDRDRLAALVTGARAAASQLDEALSKAGRAPVTNITAERLRFEALRFGDTESV